MGFPWGLLASYAGGEILGTVAETFLETTGQYSVQKIMETMNKHGLEVDESTFLGMFLQNTQDNMGAMAFRAVQSTSMMATTKIIAPIEEKSQKKKEEIKGEINSRYSAMKML